MKKKSYQGMVVRIPINIAKEVKKLREDKDLGSYGLALKYWIEQQKDEQIDSRLINLEEKIEELGKLLNTTMAITVKTNWKINVLASNPDERENKEGEQVETSEILKEIDQISPKQVWEQILAKK